MDSGMTPSTYRPLSYCCDPHCFQEGPTHLHEPNRPKASEKERMRQEITYLRQRVQELEASEERLAERIEALEQGSEIDR